MKALDTTLSLRAKITLALLVTGLTSAVLVGVIARATFMRQFNDLAFENSFQAYQGDVAAYVEAYGTLEAALQAEPYPQFVARRRQFVPAPSRTGPGARSAGDGLPPGDPPPVGGRGRRAGGRGPGGPPDFVPPFFFITLDLEGRPVLGREDPAAAPVVVTQDLKAQARPIVVRNQVVAYAVPIEQPNLTPVDTTYLDAMQSAMLYGVLGASLMALALGFFFSGRLSANLRILTRAIQAMASGDLRQHVSVRSRDEVGFLGDSFNRMSEELSRSHEMIRQQAARLEELSIRDETTGLHNRRYFDQQAVLAYARARRYGRPFTVAIGDIDHFKQVNDRYSHAAGDEVLRLVAAQLAAGTRESDILARYGGEEFVMAFPETPLREAAATCERIRRQIQDYAWENVRTGLRVTMTIGLDGDVGRGSVELMLQAADARLYDGKQNGRNRVCGIPEVAAS